MCIFKRAYTVIFKCSSNLLSQHAGMAGTQGWLCSWKPPPGPALETSSREAGAGELQTSADRATGAEGRAFWVPPPEWGPSYHYSGCQIFSLSKGQLDLVKGYSWTLKRD